MEGTRGSTAADFIKGSPASFPAGWLVVTVVSRLRQRVGTTGTALAPSPSRHTEREQNTAGCPSCPHPPSPFTTTQQGHQHNTSTHTSLPA